YIVQHNPTPNGFQTGKGAAYESDLRDKRFGRVLRLVNAAEARVATHSMQLGSASDLQLTVALKSDNFFWRRTAQRLMVERRASDPTVLAALVELVKNNELDGIGLTPSAMHAIWTLAGLNEAGVDGAQQALADACEVGFSHPSSPVRNAAVASCDAAQLPQALAAGLLQDADPRVQLTALLRIADGRNLDAVSGDQFAAMINDSLGADDILMDAWTAAAATKPIDTLVALVNSNSKSSVSDLVTSRVGVLAEHIARSNPTVEQVAALATIEPNSPLTIAIWNGLAKGWPRDLTLQLSDELQTQIRTRFLGDDVSAEAKAAVLAICDKWSINGLDEIVSKIQSQLFETASDSSADSDARLAAWDQAIRLAPTSERILDAVDMFFTPQLVPDMGGRALDSLQNARVEGLAERLLAIRGTLGPQMAGHILTLLLGRTDTTEKLLDAIAAGELQFTEFQLDQRQAILNNPSRAIASRARELMDSTGAAVTSNRQSLVDEWLPVTEMAGDVQNGVAMYKKHCALCHRHGELGVGIGPNLTGMAVHPKAEILVNVLDPSRSVENNFRTYQILTVDGLVLTGMLVGESTNSMRLV
ncbi:MAG: c-type cytochrome, partial [Planctomycetales bacterium]|nr:c-type cytochrome [Planctomycetales bacterium]